jgi:hypothetical protein
VSASASTQDNSWLSAVFCYLLTYEEFSHIVGCLHVEVIRSQDCYTLNVWSVCRDSKNRSRTTRRVPANWSDSKRLSFLVSAELPLYTMASDFLAHVYQLTFSVLSFTLHKVLCIPEHQSRQRMSASFSSDYLSILHSTSPQCSELYVCSRVSKKDGGGPGESFVRWY